FNAAGGQCQTLEADHGIPSLIGEPVIAGNYCAFFVVGSVRQRCVLEPTRRMDNELVGSKYELRADTRLEPRVRYFDEPFLTCTFSGECGRRWKGINCSLILDGCDQ